MGKRQEALLRAFDQVEFFGLKVEFAGTFAVVYFGGWAYMNHYFSPTSTDMLGVAIVHCVAYALFTWIAFMISGALFNPALTIINIIFRRLGLVTGIFYLIIQLTASIVAASLLRTVAPEQKIIDYSKGGYVGFPRSYVGFWPTMVYEMIGMCIITCTYYLSVLSKRAPKNSYGVVMGLAYGSMVLIMGNITGAACNPSRVLGPALVDKEYMALLPYICGHLGGAIIGAVLSESVLLQTSDRQSWNTAADKDKFASDNVVTEVKITQNMLDSDEDNYHGTVEDMKKIDEKNRKELEERDAKGVKKYFHRDSSDEEGAKDAHKLGPKRGKAKYEEENYEPNIYVKELPDSKKTTKGIDVIKKNEGLQKVAEVRGVDIGKTADKGKDKKNEEGVKSVPGLGKPEINDRIDPLARQPIENAPRGTDEPPPIEELDDLPPLDEPEIM